MKIVALGDSITEGFPYTLYDSWVHYTAKTLNLEIINQGICGNMTVEMLHRFARHVAAHEPTHVIILGGGNDAAMDLPLEDYAENIRGMVKLSEQYHICPILALPILSLDPAEEFWQSSYRDWLRAYAQQEDILTLDFYTPFLIAQQEDRVRPLFSDWVHPSQAGYRLMGETAVEFFRSC
ncbi:MAG: GDSL-type esterase/lipase family protein [Peptococcaceae bacterium]|jgi:lysophospholipase L1-like esterase|nr:GDSL-type esterase/lipase family protein [Peptococcaceae bacterium]